VISSSWVISTTARPQSFNQTSSFHNLAAGGRVPVAGRLIGQQHGRVGHQRTSDSDSLPLTAGQLAGQVFAPVAQPHLRQRPVDPLLAVLHPGVEQWQLDVAHSTGPGYESE
jgi:hypothetical protein